MTVRLTVVAGSGRRESRDFADPRGFVIGKAQDADFPLPTADRYAGRRHVLIELVPPRCFLHWISRNNAPLVNGQPVTFTEIHDGDIVTIGYTRIEVSLTS